MADPGDLPNAKRPRIDTSTSYLCHLWGRSTLELVDAIMHLHREAVAPAVSVSASAPPFVGPRLSAASAASILQALHEAPPQAQQFVLSFCVSLVCTETDHKIGSAMRADWEQLSRTFLTNKMDTRTLLLIMLAWMTTNPLFSNTILLHLSAVAIFGPRALRDGPACTTRLDPSDSVRARSVLTAIDASAETKRAWQLDYLAYAERREMFKEDAVLDDINEQFRSGFWLVPFSVVFVALDCVDRSAMLPDASGILPHKLLYWPFRVAGNPHYHLVLLRGGYICVPNTSYARAPIVWIAVVAMRETLRTLVDMLEAVVKRGAGGFGTGAEATAAATGVHVSTIPRQGTLVGETKRQGRNGKRDWRRDCLQDDPIGTRVRVEADVVPPAAVRTVAVDLCAHPAWTYVFFNRIGAKDLITQHTLLCSSASIWRHIDPLRVLSTPVVPSSSRRSGTPGTTALMGITDRLLLSSMQMDTVSLGASTKMRDDMRMLMEAVQQVLLSTSMPVHERAHLVSRMFISCRAVAPCVANVVVRACMFPEVALPAALQFKRVYKWFVAEQLLLAGWPTKQIDVFMTFLRGVSKRPRADTYPSMGTVMSYSEASYGWMRSRGVGRGGTTCNTVWDGTRKITGVCPMSTRPEDEWARSMLLERGREIHVEEAMGTLVGNMGAAIEHNASAAMHSENVTTKEVAELIGRKLTCRDCYAVCSNDPSTPPQWMMPILWARMPIEGAEYRGLGIGSRPASQKRVVGEVADMEDMAV